jgi:hypothetical protein
LTDDRTRPTGSASGIVLGGSTKFSEVASVAIIRLPGVCGIFVGLHAHANFCSDEKDLGRDGGLTEVVSMLHVPER